MVTIPKPRASILLRGPDDDPILATWQAGVGRVAAFTSDAKDRWGNAWLAWPEAQRFWAELSRSLARRSDPLVRLEADAAGGVLHVRADARTADGYADSLRRLTARVTLPDGRTRELALDPTGAGSYGAELPLDRPGAIAVALRDERLDAVVNTAGALLLEGEELRPARDPQLLERVAAMTGGRVRQSLVDVFRDRAGLRRAWLPLDRALLAVAALCMFLALCARRLAMPDALARALAVTGERVRRGARVRSSERDGTSETVGALLAQRRKTAERQRPAPAASDRRAPPVAAMPVVRETSAVVSAPPAPTPSEATTPRDEATPLEPAPPATPTREKSAGEKPGGKSTGSASVDALLARKRLKK